MPNTDALPYLMYKGMRGALYELKDGLNEALEREVTRVSDKGPSLWCRVDVIASAAVQTFTCLFVLFPVISLKEAGDQSTPARVKGKRAALAFLQRSYQLLETPTVSGILGCSPGGRFRIQHAQKREKLSRSTPLHCRKGEVKHRSLLHTAAFL